jgi:AraC-like DNA-binding protein
LLFSDNQEINEILQKINTKYHDHQECSNWYLKAYIYELIAFMHSHSLIKPPTSFTTQIQKIKAIVHYLDANFKSPITLDDICVATGHNKFSVCHMFKVATGKTVFEYINFLRTSYAVEKLKQNNETILEIAIESGFSSAAYFSRVFKNIMGCAPSEYRRYL